jgi:hypothetical protein
VAVARMPVGVKYIPCQFSIPENNQNLENSYLIQIKS